jgi:predicted transposase/invertase (TIGR01784 family)
MSTYNPKIDLVFRKLFGSEENADLLLSLLNGVLDCHPCLTSLTIKNPYSLATYVGGKMSILDIKAVDEHGDWYDIEMQIGEHGYYGKRALYYVAKMYVDQLVEGATYTDLHRTIGIHLLDFDYFDDARYRRHFVFKDMETNEYLEHLSYQQLYFIEMRKFRKEWSEVSTLLDRWIAFFNRAQQVDTHALPPQLSDEPTVRKAIETLDRISFTPQEREIYDAELKARLDDLEELRTAREKGLNEGEAIGEAKGRAQGRAEGRAEGEAIGEAKGEAKGRTEAMKETARNLLSAGVSAMVIAEATGMTLEEIRAVSDEGR